MAKALAVPDARRVAAAVTEIGGPVALKILSADIAHKTEAGGVALGLADGQTAAVAAREIEKRVKAHAPNAKLEGFLVQKMERGLAEVILGFRRDPLVGPTITVGLGGVLAEIYKDAATRLAPVDEAEAQADDRRGKGACHHPRLSQPAAGRCRGTGADDRRLLPAWHTRHSPRWRKPRSIRCWSSANGEGVVAVDGLVVLRRLGEACLRRLEELAEVVEHEIGGLQLVDLVGRPHDRSGLEWQRARRPGPRSRVSARRPRRGCRRHRP